MGPAPGRWELSEGSAPIGLYITINIMIIIVIIIIIIINYDAYLLLVLLTTMIYITFKGHAEVNISHGSGIWDPQYETLASWNDTNWP